jgi:DNA-binding beta-propeller fold protein YncE
MTPTSRRFMRQSACTAFSIVVTAAMLTGCGTSGSQRTNDLSGAYAFWPPFPAPPRVQFLTSYQYSDDVEPDKGGLEELIYGKQRRVLPISKPYGVAMANGRIYVCDTRNRGVVVLDLEEQQSRIMGVSGTARLQSPTDVVVAPDGLTYVSDSQRGAIFVFDQDERHVGSLGYEGLKPTGIAVSGEELFVCDFMSQAVHVLDRRSGDKLRTIGGRGDQDGQFVRPLGVAVDPEGNIYTTDVIRCRIQKFSPDGELLNAYGEIGDTVGTFVRPKLLAVDAEGIVYVVDAAFANVQMFDHEDQLLTFFGSAGSHPGSMKLPVGICINENRNDLEYFADMIHPAFNAERLVLVSNQFGTNKVSVYAMGQLHEGKTPQDVATAQAEVAPGLDPGVRIDPLTGLPAEEGLGAEPLPDDALDEGEGQENRN